MPSCHRDAGHLSSRTSTHGSYSYLSSMIRFSSVGLSNLAKVGEKKLCRPLMTTATLLKTHLLAPTLSTFSSRKALLGRNRSRFATIEASVLTEFSNASSSPKAQQSSNNHCPLSQLCCALSTSFSVKMRSIAPSTNSIESSAVKGNIKREAPL